MWHIFQVSEKSAGKKKPQRQISLMWNKQNSSEYDKLILYPFDSPLIAKTQKRKMNLFSDHIPKQSIWSRLLLLSAEWPVKSGALLKCITCTTSDKILHNPCGLVVTLLKHNAVHNCHCKIRKLTGNWHVILRFCWFLLGSVYGSFTLESDCGLTLVVACAGQRIHINESVNCCDIAWENMPAVVAVANSGFVEQTQPHLLRYPRMVGWIWCFSFFKHFFLLFCLF